MTETTSYTQIVAPAEFVTLDELEARMLEARANMEDAWKTQSVTTAEEGYSIEDAQVAIDQALAAEAAYREAYRLYEARLQSLAVLQADFELMTEWGAGGPVAGGRSTVSMFLV